MSLAIIRTGGKQYLISPGQKIKIEKIDPEGPRPQIEGGAYGAGKKENSEVVFEEVLLLQKGNKLEIGAPWVKGAKVIGKVIRQGRGKKVIAFKYHPKTRYRRKKGHRQAFTEVEITEISVQ